MSDGCDMIVSLTNLPEQRAVEGVKLKRAYVSDKRRILEFIGEHFSEGWIYEAERALLQDAGKCFIATENGELLGFACYDATAKGFFGPIGILEERRGQGIGNALLIRTLEAMREYGYGYAIIGWVSDAEQFYRKAVGAEFIKGGEPINSVYSNMIHL